MTETLVLYLFNALLGIIMYFLKQNNDALQDRIKTAETEIGRIKESTVKKEDFREFKEELWLRFDKMEMAFERRLKELSK